jgi:hypothetical protein
MNTNKKLNHPVRMRDHVEVLRVGWNLTQQVGDLVICPDAGVACQGLERWVAEVGWCEARARGHHLIVDGVPHEGPVPVE